MLILDSNCKDSKVLTQHKTIPAPTSRPLKKTYD